VTINLVAPSTCCRKIDSYPSRNDRNVRNTPFQFLPSRIEQASIETYAVNTRSIPPGGKSMLDTLGATVAFVVGAETRRKPGVNQV
jgi:hypothetical protein